MVGYSGFISHCLYLANRSNYQSNSYMEVLFRTFGFACVRVCIHACMCACVHVFMHACTHGIHTCACVLTNPGATLYIGVRSLTTLQSNAVWKTDFGSEIVKLSPGQIWTMLPLACYPVWQQTYWWLEHPKLGCASMSPSTPGLTSSH